jgi:hypothetical protein
MPYCSRLSVIRITITATFASSTAIYYHTTIASISIL